MRRWASLIVVLFVTPLFASPQSVERAKPPAEMTTYYVGLIYRGPKWTPQTTPQVEQLQKEHLANIRRLGRMGKLILAGPFTDDTNLRGMFVFEVGSLKEARLLCHTDPMVKAGRLVVELHPWYSDAGIHVDPRHAAALVAKPATRERRAEGAPRQ